MPNAIDQLHAAFTGNKDTGEATETPTDWQAKCLEWMEVARRYHTHVVDLKRVVNKCRIIDLSDRARIMRVDEEGLRWICLYKPCHQWHYLPGEFGGPCEAAWALEEALKEIDSA
jgi:hypothetical protein